MSGLENTCEGDVGRRTAHWQHRRQEFSSSNPSSPWHTWAHSREGKRKNLYQGSQFSPLPVLLFSKTTLHLAALLVCCQDTWLLQVSVAKALLKHLVPLCAVV